MPKWLLAEKNLILVKRIFQRQGQTGASLDKEKEPCSRKPPLRLVRLILSLITIDETFYAIFFIEPIIIWTKFMSILSTNFEQKQFF